MRNCFLLFVLAASGLFSQAPADSKLEPVRSRITVMERITTEAPASITVIGAPQLKQIPGVNLDDRLRMVPGFSLFRRSSSLTANPTTQGVSLRAIGSSGASRSLVLWDGMPLNDPFGGWVYWTRVAPEAIGQVEVSRGASTSVFGDRAMGGSIALFSRPIDQRRFFLGLEGGNAGQLSPSGALPSGGAAGAFPPKPGRFRPTATLSCRREFRRRCRAAGPTRRPTSTS